jgi:hypothetical protein
MLELYQQALLASGLLYALYYVYWQFTVGSKRRALIKEYGCLPVKKLPMKDPIFGIDMLMTTLKAAKEKRMLEIMANRFRDNEATTFCFSLLGMPSTDTLFPTSTSSDRT